MKSEIIAGLVSFLTAVAGLSGAPVDQQQSSEGPQLQAGSAHAHALFYLNVDGEEVNFTERKYQVRSPYVHLENFKPHIVHKHSENVTWGYFLDSIDVELDDNCVSFKNRTECGNISVMLNGNESGLDVEINQSDNFAILLNSSKLSEGYMSEELPEAYTPRAVGRIA